MQIKTISLSTSILCRDREPYISSENGKDITLSVHTDHHTAVIEVTLTEDDLSKIDDFVTAMQAKQEGFGL